MSTPVGLFTSISLCLAAACGRAERRADTVRSDATPAVGESRAAWVVTPRGLGPLQVGMSRSQAETIVGGSLDIGGNSAWKACGYTPSERLPSGVRIMVEDGTIARIDVRAGNVATAEGARIGDSEDRIRQLYGSRMATSPHKYTNGHYLTIAAVGADSAFRIVFETDGARVTQYRAGRLPSVAYVEGCA
jgi:hypothetical protein